MNNFDLHEQAQQLADTRSAYSLARELLEAKAQLAVTDGWKLVPQEVTLKMQHAYFEVIDKNMRRVETDCRFGRYDSAKEAYASMLSATPKPGEL